MVKDMNKTTKELISEYLTDQTKKFDLVHADAFTTVAISDALHISRTITSQYLNELCESNEVFKVKSRPVYFFNTRCLNQRYGINIENYEFIDLEEMVEFLQDNGQLTDVFAELIGHDGSLKRVIKRCTEAFNYPPNGLSFVIYGNEGTGKKSLAKLICKHSILSKGILDKDAKIAEYDLSVIDPQTINQQLQDCINANKQNSLCIILSHFEKISDPLTGYLIRFFEKKQNDRIHFIFLSNERPDDYLPSSLGKYIPIAVKLKDFSERPKEEREGIIVELFRKEAASLHVHMLICSNVLKTLSNFQPNQNVEEIFKKVKLICAQAISNQKSDTVTIHTYYLPEEMFESLEISSENISYIDCDTYTKSSKISQFDELFNSVIKLCIKKESNLIEKYRSIYDLIVETIMSTSRNEQTLKGTEATLALIVNQIAKKHFINIPGNFTFVVAKLMYIYEENESMFKQREDKEKVNIEAALNKVKRMYVSEAMIANEIKSLCMSNLEKEIPGIVQLIMILTIVAYNVELNKNKTFGVIICHGYSTASSMAAAVNSLIGSYIFDSIDMPVTTTMEEIRATLRDKLSRVNAYADLCIMVDMGSLENIVDEEFTKNRNVALINNVTTKMALDIGYKIKNGVPIDRYFIDADKNYKVDYAILKGKKKDVILFTSESGLQTSQRMADLFADSFPEEIPVDLRAVPFDSLIDDINELQQMYNILFITGTDNPLISDVVFIPLEDIVTTTNLDLVSSKLNMYLDDNNLKQLIINIRTNFSLMNVLNYLTILNPKPLMDETTIAVEDLQKRRHVELEGRTLVGIYIHVCILVERLVTKTGMIREDSATESFVKEHGDFIEDIKASFGNIEKHYSIQIPDSEMKYIYSFIYRED